MHYPGLSPTQKFWCLCVQFQASLLSTSEDWASKEPVRPWWPSSYCLVHSVSPPHCEGLGVVYSVNLCFHISHLDQIILGIYALLRVHDFLCLWELEHFYSPPTSPQNEAEAFHGRKSVRHKCNVQCRGKLHDFFFF